MSAGDLGGYHTDFTQDAKFKTSKNFNGRV